MPIDAWPINLRVIAVVALGAAAAALFAFGIGTWRRGWTYGLACGFFAAVLVAAVLLPLCLGLITCGMRLS